jgi:hypothetical protein
MLKFRQHQRGMQEDKQGKQLRLRGDAIIIFTSINLFTSTEAAVWTILKARAFKSKNSEPVLFIVHKASPGWSKHELWVIVDK